MNQLIPIGETKVRAMGARGRYRSHYILIPKNQADMLARTGYRPGAKILILRSSASNDIILRLADTGEEEG